ncbi:MAG: thioesterase, partial [Lysobacteraceae bacterium]
MPVCRAPCSIRITPCGARNGHFRARATPSGVARAARHDQIRRVSSLLLRGSTSEAEMTVELKCLAPRPMASLRLLCFPFAGAGIAVFRNWADLLPRHVEPWAAQLPAREDRLREAGYDAWPALHEDLVSAFNRLPAQPTALFGHSMGAVMAFELARYLQASGKPAPKHLFVSGRTWPGTGLPQDHGIDLRDDAGLLAMMEGRYGSLPASMAHPEIREMAVETLRSDLRLLDSYQYRPGLPLENLTERPIDFRRNLPRTLPQNPRGQRASGFDVGGIIQQHERLLGNVGADTIRRALLPGRRIKREQARMEERTLPMSVETAPVLLFALVGMILAHREVQVLPVARRLIRLHTGSADLWCQQSSRR